ncbi:hypothetical protein LSAT2_004376 [Lamellibrachia satsuma]|nr:hypothetical protein LSAT2_004376 [Lamellibrachia satsuma]
METQTSNGSNHDLNAPTASSVTEEIDVICLNEKTRETNDTVGEVNDAIQLTTNVAVSDEEDMNDALVLEGASNTSKTVHFENEGAHGTSQSTTDDTEIVQDPVSLSSKMTWNNTDVRLFPYRETYRDELRHLNDGVEQFKLQCHKEMAEFKKRIKQTKNELTEELRILDKEKDERRYMTYV